MINPRQQVVYDFAEFLSTLQGHQLIITMDANEVITDRDPISIFTFMEDLGLVPAYNLVTTDLSTLPTTYIRGTKCIDYVYVTRPILQSLRSVTVHPFGLAFTSDHRPITIQLNTGTISHDLTRVSYRQIRVNRIKKSQAFSEYLRITMQYHKIKERMSMISSQMEDDPTEHHRKQWNRFDVEKGRYIQAGINKFSKGVHDSPWSKPLARSGATCRYWTERLNAFTHAYIIQDKWVQLQQELNIEPLEDDTEVELVLRMKQAVAIYKQMKKNAIPLRDQWLEDLADEYAQGDQHKKAKKVRELRKKEKLRSSYQSLTLSFQGPRVPLTSVLIPDGDTYRLTSDPHEMNIALCATNKKQLKASSTSPFVTGALNIVGRDGFTEAAEEILAGSSPLIYSPTINAALTHLSRVCPPMNIDFTDEVANANRFREAMMITRENIIFSIWHPLRHI